ncbi:hypothetical protein [Nocardioides litoris]|uniref:hypothetical protein n=1 Tax=Nocardioides litoris TaxID=1926648 RepID=UPI00111D1034|nr:hypothetical protein [Nocardioides litoris]
MSTRPTPVVVLESFRGEYADRSAWAVVRVDGPGWIGTLPVHELELLCAGPDGVPLHGLPHRREGDHVEITLGPARVRGRVAEWRDLVERLLTTPRTTGELLESPSGRPWDGPVSDVRVADVRVAHEPARPETPAEVLAAAAGMDLDRFIELLGDVWRAVPGEGPLGTYLWGEPAQLAAEPVLDGLEIGTPRARWTTHLSHYEVLDRRLVTGDQTDEEVRDAVAPLLRRRRRGFRWCRYCGQMLAPDARFARDTCYGCATARLGVVY